MSVTPQSLAGGSEQALKTVSDAIFSTLHVAMPGVIQSFDPGDAHTPPSVVAQPALKGQLNDAIGNVKSAPLPLLVDVPVFFPRGGGCSMTFPVRKGDECLLIFSDRCIDFWWQSGGIQETVDPRQHDLSDAFAIVGLQSGQTKIADISTDAVQLRTDDGRAFIELRQNGEVTITTPHLTINSDTTINGEVKVNGGITSTGDQVAHGISQIDHVHGGVESGSGKTEKPQ